MTNQTFHEAYSYKRKKRKNRIYDLGKEIDRNFKKVEPSYLLTLLKVDPQYGIFSKNKLGTRINTGSFKEYRWHYEVTLVSHKSIFYPSEVGSYDLEEKILNGRIFTTDITNYNQCYLNTELLIK